MMEKVIYRFRILYDGWELDNEGWIVEDEKGKRTLRSTSHGTEFDWNKEGLIEKIVETQASLDGLKQAYKLMYDGEYDEQEK